MARPWQRCAGAARFRTRRVTSGLAYSYSYATDLASWTPFVPGNEFTDGGSPVETITVTVPASLLGSSKLFVKVAAR